MQQIGPSERSGPGYCPRIDATGEAAEILVADSSQKTIEIRALGIVKSILQTPLACQFKIEGRQTRVTAQLLNNTVICDSVNFVYTSNSPSVTVPFDVIWGGSKPLDNIANIHGKRFHFSFKMKTG